MRSACIQPPLLDPWPLAWTRAPDSKGGHLALNLTHCVDTTDERKIPLVHAHLHTRVHRHRHGHAHTDPIAHTPPPTHFIPNRTQTSSITQQPLPRRSLGFGEQLTGPVLAGPLASIATTGRSAAPGPQLSCQEIQLSSKSPATAVTSKCERACSTQVQSITNANAMPFAGHTPAHRPITDTAKQLGQASPSPLGTTLGHHV